MHKNFSNVNFSLTKLGARAFPTVLRYTVEVRMTDNSTYRGKLHIIPPNKAPTWYRSEIAETITNCRAFIRLDIDEHFYAQLVPYHRLPGHDPRQHHPTYAEIRLEFVEFYSAPNFQLYPLNRRQIPPINHIYVIMPGGSVYTSQLNTPYHISYGYFPPNS